jgi:hypothetical protein
MSQLTDLPMSGGDVTGVANTPDDGIVAVIDGKLYSMNGSGGAMQLINDDAPHSAIGLAPDGTLYAVTATDLRAYDLTTGAHRSVPIDPAGPNGGGMRIEETEVIISPSGQPYIRLINNRPQTYIYTSTDKGTSWTALKMPDGFRYGGGLAFTPGGDMLLSGAFGFYRSSDGGTTWTTYPAAYANYGPSLVATSNNDIYAYVRGGGGMRVSHDGGASFSDLSQFNRSPFFTALAKGQDGSLYALASRSSQSAPSSSPTGLLRSTDGGTTWHHVVYAQGHVLAMRGPGTVIGLAAASSDGRSGGLMISHDGTATWTTAGMTKVSTITDVGFDRNGALMILADGGIYRRTSGGWQTLGAQSSEFSRFATTPDGTLAVANLTTVFRSNDNGVSWSEMAIPNYLPAFNGTPAVTTLIGRRNGDFLLSITNYADATGYVNGQIYRVGTDGTPAKLAPSGNSFATITEDRDGVLYGVTSTLSQLTYTFNSESYSSTDGGASWQKGGNGPGISGVNSKNRYFAITGQSSYAMRTAASDQKTDITLSGFTSQGNYIRRAAFGPDDRLYIITLDKGLFVSSAAVE